jgi:hypothetical protein
MKLTTSFLQRAAVLRALVASIAVGIIGGGASAWAPPLDRTLTRPGRIAQSNLLDTQNQTTAQQPPASEAEKQAFTKVQSAPDPAAQLEAAGAFIKQFPKSALRTQVAKFVADKIARQPDATQTITLAEHFSTVFTEASEKEIITPVLLDGYLRANRVDDSFRVAPAWLEKNQEDISTLTQMALMGVNQIKREGEKAKNLVAPSQQYAAQAIALIEANKKPATLNDSQWSEYRTRWLPALYQAQGIVSLMGGNNAEAKAKLEKAVSLDAGDPLNYALLGNLVDDEYQQLAMQYRDMPAGAAREEKLKQALAKMQQVVALYAQAIALAEDNSQYQPLTGQVKPQLESYYKFLHDGSTKGLPELIQQYKKK